MESKPLVSIVTPAYNTGEYIGNLLESILLQTYPKMEMYVIDDGSTDNTKIMVEKYIPRFKKRNIKLEYIYQNNSGQSVAINNALKLVTGKYLVWPDSDDYYNSPLTIERMVSEFEKSGEQIGMVRTQERLVKKEKGETIVIGTSGLNSKAYYKPNEIFEDCLFSNNFFFCSGAYMIDMELFKQFNGLEIYTEKDAGQNWQILLPLLYNFPCITILEPLYNVVVRSNSHSRGQYKGFTAEVSKKVAYRNTILYTLDRIDIPEETRKRYKKEITDKYTYELFKIAIRYSRKKEGIEYFKQIPKNKRDSKIRVMKYLLKFGLSKKILNFYTLLKNK